MNHQIIQQIEFITSECTHKKFGIMLIAPKKSRDDYDEIVKIYDDQFGRHNAKVLEPYYNAGVDLMSVEAIKSKESRVKVDFDVKCEFFTYNKKSAEYTSTAYYICSRSSMSKKEFMPAIGCGIMDNNFRGYISAYVKKDYDQEIINIEKHERLYQLVHPCLYPVLAFIVDENSLSKTDRGEKGFGSTGRGHKS